MRNVKKFIVFFAVILTFTLNTENFAVLNTSAFTPDVEIYSRGVFMVNLDTDICVYGKNQFETISPASTTKIMTALLVLENAGNLNDFVTATNEMNSRFNENYNFKDASVADFAVGQNNITYMDCLLALMIYSACDAANVLAYSIAGDIPSFVDMMNRKAKEIGCVNTNFSNPHGLHEKENYSCAYDIFKITKYAYEKFPLFMEIVSTKEHRLPANSRNPDGVHIANRNRLMMNTAENPYFYEFAKGVKTGSVDYFYDVETGEYSEGIFNLVSTASKNGYTYLLVTLGAPYHDLNDPSAPQPNYVYKDHLALYRWAFASLEYKAVLSADDILAQVYVKNGQEADRVQLKPAADYNTLLPKDLDKTAVLQDITIYEEEITAPVTKGEILGYVELKLAGETLEGGRIDLIAADSVSESTPSIVVEKVSGIFGKLWFQTGAAVIAALTVFVIILRAINASRTKKRRQNKRIKR